MGEHGTPEGVSTERVSTEHREEMEHGVSYMVSTEPAKGEHSTTHDEHGVTQIISTKSYKGENGVPKRNSTEQAGKDGGAPKAGTQCAPQS